MALIGTVKFSELMTWGSWRKKDVITDIPNTKVINNSYNKLKSQLKNMTENIKKYLMGMVINYGEEGYDDSYILHLSFKVNMFKDESDKVEAIEVSNDRNVFIHLYGHMYKYEIHEFDFENQIKIMNKVEEKISKMEIKHRTNFKF